MSKSNELFQRAKKHIPGGVNSPVRAFQGVDSTPIFFKQGIGAYLIDVEDKHYVDYLGSWGPLILGHCDPKVIEATADSLMKGLSFGAPTQIETQMAETVSQLVPSMEMVRMVNSGTEATMTAVRLARGFTQRDKIIKFAGCYHGHCDSLLAKAGSGLLTLGLPSTPGIPKSHTEDTLIAPFNDLQAVEQLMDKYSDSIAAIIVEPIAGNMGCIPPTDNFLSGLRKLCDQYRSLLIFDEVMTGFRVALGGAQALYEVTPDLTTLGKIIGGGMPVGALGGSTAIMEHLAPLGPVYQAGTLSGNPVALAAGLATLNQIKKPQFHTKLAKQTEKIVDGLRTRAEAANVPLVANSVNGMFSLFFTEQNEVNTFDHVSECNQEQFKAYFHGMLERNVYFAPSAFESCFVSGAHGNDEIQLTLDAAEEVFASIGS